MSRLLSREGSDLENDPQSRVATGQLEPGEENSWDRFVTSSAMGTFFHLTGWGAVVEKVLEHRSFRLVARTAHGISGVFPVSLMRNKLFGDCLVSLPLAVYGGICADDEESYFR